MVQSNDPIAAAVAAAAELAKNGGDLLFLHNRSLDLSTLRTNNKEISSPPSFSLIPTVPQSPSPTMHLHPQTSEDDDEEDEELDAERRIARSRERNREHARRTRLRKKAQLEALQCKVKGLQAESKVLKQSLEECCIATILMRLSSGSKNKSQDDDSSLQKLFRITAMSGQEDEEQDNSMDKKNNKKNDRDLLHLMGGKRKRFVSDACERTSQCLTIDINGQTTTIGGGRTHINWKTGVYSDENGVQKHMTQEQLESLRRERNRMHAKMTRDRKKNFIATIEKTIAELESKNLQMKQVLADVVQTHFPERTPARSSSSPAVVVPSDDWSVPSLQASEEEEVVATRPRKKSRHPHNHHWMLAAS